VIWEQWVAWAVLLMLQNASFTLVSRARNTASIWYHAFASLGSNGIWFVSQYFLIDQMIKVITHSSFLYGLFIFAFYTTFTMIGSVSMHYFAMHFLEKGQRQIGAMPKEAHA
jgi:hypothetical protein